MDLNGTVSASEDDDEDELFHSCLSTCSISSLDSDVSTGAGHAPYFDPLRLSAKDAGKPNSRKDIHDLDDFHALEDLWNPLSLPGCASAVVTNGSAGPGEQSRKDNSSAANENISDRMANVANPLDPDSLLNKTLTSLQISSDDSIGQSWLTADLTTVSSLSEDSSCSLHSVRIERQPVSDGDKHSSLVETLLIPAEVIDADTSCQHGNLECSYLSDDRSMLQDWKTSNDAIKVAVLASVKALSAAELRRRLAEFGQSPGPITESTRRLHELSLSRLMASSDRSTTTAAAAAAAAHHIDAGQFDFSVYCFGAVQFH